MPNGIQHIKYKNVLANYAIIYCQEPEKEWLLCGMNSGADDPTEKTRVYMSVRNLKYGADIVMDSEVISSNIYEPNSELAAKYKDTSKQRKK